MHTLPFPLRSAQDCLTSAVREGHSARVGRGCFFFVNSVSSAAYADLDCCDGTVGTATDISTGICCCVAESVGIMVGVELAGLGLIVGIVVGMKVGR